MERGFDGPILLGFSGILFVQGADFTFKWDTPRAWIRRNQSDLVG
jgi:hypothetical protein